jgi:hypothetical protein
VQSGRALHQAARAAIEARWFADWCRKAPYAWLHERFVSAIECLAAWPKPETYDELARAVPQPAGTELPRFVAQAREALRQSGGYEQHVARERAVPTRERSWHDFFNMAVWAHFPRVRWALNSIHVDGSLGPIDPRNGRAPQQNVASQLDESGLIVASSDRQLLRGLRELRFKHVFWERRAELLATTRFFIIGHGTLESLLTPHLGLASKALLLDLPRPPCSYDDDELRHGIDGRVAAIIAGWRDAAPLLDPVPLLGIPDYADNAAGDFYDDARYFRFQRRPRR